MPDVPDRLAAALADRYRIDRELGEGGMATVYLAQDEKHGRKVAIKVLKPELAAMVGAGRFLSEIRTTANLQHPHILPLFDSGEADGFLFYVMPYVEGETLRDRISREKQLPVDDAVDIARKVASALDAAHRHGVIHRDIKPANILLQDGEPQVADFGIALAVQTAGGGRLTETGLSLGTPFYMSPEQATGDRDPDPRSDLYSLGCVTYEMLTGDPPFTGSTAQSVLAKILTDEAPVVTKVRKTVPAHVAAAVAKATQRLPADRFATAGDFADALVDPAFRFGGVGAATGGAAGSGAGHDAGRAGGSRPWMAATGILAVVAAALGFLALGGSGGGEAVEPLVLRMTLPDSQALTYPLDIMSTALSDDGTTLVYVGPGPNGQPRLWVKRRWERTPTPLQGTDGVSVFDVSPDGAEVAFVTAGSRMLRSVPAAGGTPRTLLPEVQNRGLHWGEDGYIYFQNTSTGISRVAVAGGEVEPVAGRVEGEGDTPELTWPWLLPGGEQLLVSRWGTTGASDSIAVVDLPSGETTVLARGNTGQFMPPSHLLIGTNDGVLSVWEYDPVTRALVGSGRSVADDVRSLGTAAVDFYAGADGTLLYVAGAGNVRSPAWVTRAGESEPVREGWEGDFTDVALSPDGRRMTTSILNSDRADVWVLTLDGADTPPQRVTFDQPGITRPVWNHRGDTVLYLAGRSQDESDMTIQAVQWNGIGSPRTVLARDETPGDAALNEVQISREGRWMIYRLGTGDSNRDIFAVERGGGGSPVAVAASPASEAAPMLSPDGRFIAYISNESGGYEVYVRPFPDVDRGKWIVSSAGGSEPAWSEDGGSLFYRDSRGRMIEVLWDSQGVGGVLGRNELFDTNRFFNNQYHTSYAVHPDGRFLMLEASTDDQLGLIWMQNFPASLRDGS